MQENQKVFQEYDKKYHFNSIFFAHTDVTPWAKYFLNSIINNQNWKMLYLDDTVVILVKDNSINKRIIDKYSMIEENVKISNFKHNNINSLFTLAHFFKEVGWSTEELQMNKDVLLVNPMQCTALDNVNALLEQQNSPLAQIYANKFNSYCGEQ